jgi:error-prone DNA polymerase
VTSFDPDAPDESAEHRRDGNFAVRLGLASVRGIGRDVAERVAAERRRHGPYRSLEDLAGRTGLSASQLEALGAAGACDGLGLSRREALWRAGPASQERSGFLPDTSVPMQAPLFPEPSAFETLADDLWATGISVDDHPIAHLRAELRSRGVLASIDLRTAEPGRRVEVAGLVTHRQRPMTASGITFVNIEDEHGIVNIVCSTGLWARHRRVARESKALIARGILERSAEGVTNLLADRLEPLPIAVPHSSRDFQ